ncbi:MAG: IS630 family transposase [Candidatus Binatia bacterium]
MSYCPLWRRCRMRPQGSPAELERRRVRAIELLERGLQPHVVAERLGVDRRSVRRWNRAYRLRGRDGLRSHPAPGRPPRLTRQQRGSLVRWILRGPEACGYPTALWTCQRIVELIRTRFGITYHPDHVGRLLRACGFSPQRPQRTAKERNARRISHWLRHTWPRVKKTRAPRRPAGLPR